MKNSSDSSDGFEGNTTTSNHKKQDGASKRWVFTLNNYTAEEKNSISELVNKEIGIVGKEIGEEGTPHLQGYIEFSKPIRLTGLKKINKKIHWEKSKGDRLQNFKYCSKDGDFEQNIYDDDVLSYPKCEIFDTLIEIFNGKPDKRKIHVVIDEKGGMGKTSFSKYLYHNRNGVYILSGKGADMKCAIKMLMKTQGEPKIILIDVPRSAQGFISWQGIEEVKNGLFFSGKYEPDMVSYKRPHVVVMTNEEPVLDKLSADRWDIYRRETE